MRSQWLLRAMLAFIVVICAVGIFRARAERPEVTIRIAFLASKDDEDYIGASAFERSVEQASGGRIGVEIFPSGQFCGSERECIEALQGGILEVNQTTFGGLAALFAPAQVLDLPYAFASDAIAECVMDGPLLGDMGDAILGQGLGLRLMAVGNTGGWRSLVTTERHIGAPDDMRGLRIRTLPSALEQEMVRELGANPTPIPWSEVYYALSAGLLDGTKNSVQDVVGMKLHEHLRYLLADRHAYMGNMWWYSERQWQALPDDLKPLVAEGFHHRGLRGARWYGRSRDAGSARRISRGDPRTARMVCGALWSRVAAAARRGRGGLRKEDGRKRCEFCSLMPETIAVRRPPRRYAGRSPRVAGPRARCGSLRRV